MPSAISTVSAASPMPSAAPRGSRLADDRLFLKAPKPIRSPTTTARSRHQRGFAALAVFRSLTSLTNSNPARTARSASS